MKHDSSEAPGFATWCAHDGYAAPGYFASPADGSAFIRLELKQGPLIASCPGNQNTLDPEQLQVLAAHLVAARQTYAITSGWLQEYCSLYSPYLMSRVEALRVGDLRASRDQIFNILRADLWCMHSGYLRSHIYRYIGRISLLEEDSNRLAGIFVTSLLKGKRVENRVLVRGLARYNPRAFHQVITTLRSIGDDHSNSVVSWVLGVVRYGDAADPTL